MFNPQEWTKQLIQDVQGKTRIIYINEHTGLSKLRATFTQEQQKELEREGSKLYLSSKKEGRKESD